MTKVTITFPDRDCAERFVYVLKHLLEGKPGLRAIACALYRLAIRAITIDIE